jgi:hypothetical protein
MNAKKQDGLISGDAKFLLVIKKNTTNGLTNENRALNFICENVCITHDCFIYIYTTSSVFAITISEMLGDKTDIHKKKK